MANEAVIIELLGNGGDPIQVTVADGTGIEKGTLLKLSDPRTAAATSADNDIFIGIAAEEKVANDGKTSIAAYTNGIFDLTDSGAGITVGTDVVIAGANTIKTYTTLDDEKGYKVGKALETAGAGEVISVLVRLN
jgi:hypothetical protein